MVFSLQILRQLTVKFTTILRQIGVTTRYEIKSHGIKKAWKTKYPSKKHWFFKLFIF